MYTINTHLNKKIEKGVRITSENISHLSLIDKEKRYKSILEIDIQFSSVNFYSKLEEFYRAILINIRNKRNGWKIFKPKFLIRIGFLATSACFTVRRIFGV